MNQTADDDRPVPWDELPAWLREQIGLSLPAGHAIWACPRGNGRGGVHTEWWWEDEQGQLVEAFWRD